MLASQPEGPAYCNLVLYPEGTVQQASYPALFRSADEASYQKQVIYLRLIGAEYSVLLLAAVLSLNVFAGPTFYLVYALVFVVLIVLLLTRTLLKPEQDWYRCRALAESVKTLTWRYIMRAAPFGDAPQLQGPREEFRNQLHRIFDENRATAEKIAHNWSADDQITSEMDSVRSLDLNGRKRYYATERVDDQRKWYAREAAANKNSAKKWVAVGIGAYALAGVLALARIRFPEWQFWPVTPIIVLASSVIGWMQVKKFNELGTAYTVAAHEIGLIRPKLDDVRTESELSDFVTDAELAFSREHTLWVARRTK
jgi:hypothetical protein